MAPDLRVRCGGVEVESKPITAWRLREAFEALRVSGRELLIDLASAHYKSSDRAAYNRSMENLWPEILEKLRRGELIGSGCRPDSDETKDISPRLYSDDLPDFLAGQMKIGGTTYHGIEIRLRGSIEAPISEKPESLSGIIV